MINENMTIMSPNAVNSPQYFPPWNKNAKKTCKPDITTNIAAQAKFKFFQPFRLRLKSDQINVE